MSKRLVVVEDAFAARGAGVLVRPAIDAEGDVRATFSVRIRKPDGAERAATAALEVPHIRGPLPPRAMLRIIDATVDDLPAGTEIWRD